MCSHMKKKTFHSVLFEVKLKWIVLLNILLLTSTSQNVATVTLEIIISPQISSSPLSSSSFSSSLSPLSLLPPSKPFHSCWVLVLHKLPSGILNQSPATKGESLWLITERRAHDTHRQTHEEAKGGWSLRARKLTPLQKTWHHMRKGGRWGGGDQPIWVKPVLATPATHYLLITSSLTGAQF